MGCNCKVQATHSGQETAKAARAGVQDRYVLWFAALLALVCSCLAPRLDPGQWERQRWSFLAQRAIDGLLEQGGLPTRVEDVRERLPLALQGMGSSEDQEQGLVSAMAQHPGVNESPESAHRLLAATHQWGSIYSVELRLVRRGWALRVQSLERMIHVPWIPTLALVLGGLCCLGRTPRWLIMPVAGGSAQAMLAYCRRGEAYREIPVHWTEWPQGWYGEVEALWSSWIVEHPTWSWGFALSCLAIGWMSSAYSARAGRSMGWQDLGIGALWVLGSLAWWDASFRTGLPIAVLDGQGASLMRMSHVLRGLAWICTGMLLLRERANAQARGQKAVSTRNDRESAS